MSDSPLMQAIAALPPTVNRTLFAGVFENGTDRRLQPMRG
jgi:hypothetical protein